MSDAETGYFLTDALGSVRHANFAPPSALREWGVTDAAGAIVLVRDYSPYGETTQSLGSYETHNSYTGEMTDASGLVYLRARYYDPATGRFVSRDTWEGNSQNPISLGKWNYAYANPLIFTDPIGRFPIPIASCGPVLAAALSNGGINIVFDAGLAFCLAVVGVTALVAILPLADPEVREKVEEDVSLACQLFQLPVAPEPQNTPEPELKPMPVPMPGPLGTQVTETPSPKKKFFFSEIGGYPTPGRDNAGIIRDLEAISYIPGINGMISQLSSASPFALMGRKFEAERAIYYYLRGNLVDVNSTSFLYDIQVNNVASIRYIEVKWSEGTISKSTLKGVVQEAKMHLSGTFLLEATWIRLEDQAYLVNEGGLPYP